MTERRDSLPRIGWIVIIMAIVFVGQGAYYQWESRRLAECQFQVNRDFKQQVITNRQTANEARQGLIDFLTALDQCSSDEDFNKARKEYLRITQDQQDRALEQMKHSDALLERC